MCVGRRINEDRTSDLKKATDPDSREFYKRVKASRISEIDVPFYKIPGVTKKGNKSTIFQKK